MRARVLAAAGVLVLLSGCATTSGSWSGGWWVRPVTIEGPEGRSVNMLRYRTAAPTEGWSEGEAPPGDYAFYNRRFGATIYADSSCGKKYDDSPLSVLSNHLTMGFDNVEEIEETEGMLSGRASLERLSNAQLDGVPVQLASTVVKKGPCVFDLILVSHPSHFDAALSDYRSIRDGFEAQYDQ